MTAEVFGFILHIVFNYIFVARLGLGIKGTAYSESCTSAVCLAFNLIYSAFIEEISEAIQLPK